MDRTRLSLDIPAEARSQMEVLEKRTKARSLTEVICRSLAIYDLITEHQAEGGKLQFKHSDGEVETLRVV